MKSLIFILVVTIFSSCASKYEREKFSYDSVVNPWVTAYKQKAFYACLKESYRNDSILILMKKEDMFNRYMIKFSAIDSARAIGKKVSKEIMSREYLLDYEEKDMEYPPKPISSTCLRFYESRELDSIARAAYFIEFNKKYNRKTW